MDVDMLRAQIDRYRGRDVVVAGLYVDGSGVASQSGVEFDIENCGASLRVQFAGPAPDDLGNPDVRWLIWGRLDRAGERVIAERHAHELAWKPRVDEHGQLLPSPVSRCRRSDSEPLPPGSSVSR